jgi:hypothetical protein
MLRAGRPRTASRQMNAIRRAGCEILHKASPRRRRQRIGSAIAIREVPVRGQMSVFPVRRAAAPKFSGRSLHSDPALQIGVDHSIYGPRGQVRYGAVKPRALTIR